MTYSATVLADSPIRYYRTNEVTEKAADASGNSFHGAYTGTGLTRQSATLSTGDGDGSLTFGGSSWVTLPAEALVGGSGAWSFDCLLKVTANPAADMVVFGWGTETTNHAIFAAISTVTGVVKLRVDAWSNALIPGVALTLNTVYHVAVTYNGSVVTLYLNGVSQGTATLTLALDRIWGRIGAVGTAAGSFVLSGAIVDEFAYYHQALTSTRVAAHNSAIGSGYASAVLTDTPTVFYRLNDAVGTRGLTDSSTSAQNATPTSGIGVAQAPSLIVEAGNSAILLDGSNSSFYSLPTTGLPTGNAAFTLEAWARYEGGSGATEVILAIGASTTNQGAYLGLTTSGNASAGNGSVFVNSATSLTIGQVAHLAVTYDGVSAWKLYINGVLAGTLSSAVSLVAGTPQIGAWGSGFFFGGIAGEIAVYSTALSPGRVSAHYLAGLATLTSYDSAVLSDNPAFYWHLNETSGTTVGDSSGNGRSGTITGTPTYGVTGLTNDGGTAIKLANGAYITTALDTAQQTANRSFEAWVRAGSNISPTSSGIPIGMIASDGVTGGLEFGQINAADDVWFRRVDGAGNRVTASINGLSGAGTLFDGKVHHVVETYDGAHIVVYIDGAQVASVAATGALGWTNTAGGFMLNGYFDGTTRFTLANWTYDDVAIYPVALAAARVSAHYTAGVPTSNPGRTGATTYQTTVLADNPLLLWPLDETSGSSFADASGNGRPGTIDGTAAGVTYAQPGLTSDGGTSVTLASTVALQLVTVDPGMRTTSAVSYELWTKEGSTTTDGIAMLASGGTHGGMLLGQLTTSTNMEFRVALGGGVFSSGVNLTPATYFGDGLRHHVVATYDGATLAVYVDGALAGSVAVTGPVDYSNVGSGLLLNDYFDGSAAHVLNGWGFDNFAVYGTALSASQVSAHFSAGNSPFGGRIAPSFAGSAAASQVQPLAGTIAPRLTGTAAALVGLALSGTVQPLASWLVSTTLRNVIGGTITSPLIGLVTLSNSVNAVVAPDLSGLPVLPLPVDPNAPRAFRLNGTDLPPASLISYPVGNSRTWFARQSLLLVWRGLSVSAANMLLAYAAATPATVDILMPSFRWNANVPVRLVTAGQADPAVLGLAGPGQGTLGVPANPPGMYNGVVVARLELLADIPILPPLVS